MKLWTIRRILREDLQKTGDLPGWVDNLLQPLNTFIDNVVLSLRNNLTFLDNFSGRQVTLNFKSGVELSLNPGTLGKVVGVLILSSSGALVENWGWSRKTDAQVGVTITFAGGVTDADCTIFILYGG